MEENIALILAEVQKSNEFAQLQFHATCCLIGVLLGVGVLLILAVMFDWI